MCFASIHCALVASVTTHDYRISVLNYYFYILFNAMSVAVLYQNDQMALNIGRMGVLHEVVRLIEVRMQIFPTISPTPHPLPFRSSNIILRFLFFVFFVSFDFAI
jgi:hypothetical protein